MYKQIFKEPNDFDLCDGVFLALSSVTGNELDANAEPIWCRTVTLVWHSLGLIENGGFARFIDGEFVGDPDYALTYQAYVDIGAAAAAAAFHDALSLRDVEHRSPSILTSLEDRFYRTEPEIVAKLAGYCRANKSAILCYLQTRKGVRGQIE